MMFHYNEQVEEPTQRVMKYGFPLNVVGMYLPLWLRKHVSNPSYNMRTVELPFLFNNIPSPAPKGATVLDFGCCESRNALHLASVGYKVYGIDYQADYAFPHENINFVRGDMLNVDGQYYAKPVPFYDYIIAISSIEHSGLPAYGNIKIDSRAPRQIMRIFKTVIKPTGKLILTVPYAKKYEETPFERHYDDMALENLFNGLFKMNKKIIFEQEHPNPWKVACIVGSPVN